MKRGDQCACGRDVWQCVRDAVSEVFGDVFRGWVQRVEWRRGVEVGVGERAEDVGEGVVEGVEIQEQAVGIQGWAAEGDGEVEVVAVDRFGYAADEEGVCGTELTVHGDVEHGGRV